MTYPGLGGQQPPPQNASPAGQLTPGVTPGVSGQVVATRVIIIGSGGELLVYSPTAAAGNLVASVAGAAGTDSFGNSFPEGIAAYVTVSGDTYYIQLGQGSFFGTPAGGIFIHDQTSPPANDPNVLGIATAAGGGSLLLSSGGGTQSGIQISDATASGTTAGQITLSTGAVSLDTSASTTIPTAAPSRTALGSTWNATTAAQCNQNFVNIINSLGSVGIFV